MTEPRMPTTLPSPVDREEFRFVAVDAGAIWEWIVREMVWVRVVEDGDKVGEAGGRCVPALIGATLTAALAKRVCSTPRGSFRVRGPSREDASALVAVVQARNTPGGVDDVPIRRVFQPRFSPACVGNTSPSDPASRDRPVQPRVRGEHSMMNCIHTALAGSAPRARGTRGRT